MDMESDLDNVTCRICRGEGTPEEPLYHPCKCNGSIKYVHQDCLFEWLKHTKGKASCELCHTPYKLTKLYAKDMPKTIPIRVFVSKLISDIVDQSVKAFRLVVAITVYLIAVPYLTYRGVRMHTAFAELFPYNLSIFLDFSRFINHILILKNHSVDRNITLPFGMDSMVRRGFKNFLLDVFQGLELMAFLALFICIIMFVREWILQNDPFLLHFEQNQLNDRDIAPDLEDHDILRNERIEAALRNIVDRERREPHEGFENLNDEELQRAIRAFEPAQEQNALPEMEEMPENQDQDPNLELPEEPNQDEEVPLEDVENVLDFLGWHRPVLSLISIGTIVYCVLFLITFAIYMIPYALGRVFLAFLGWTIIPFVWRIANIVIYAAKTVEFHTLSYLMRAFESLSIPHADVFSQEIFLAKDLIHRRGIGYIIREGYTPWRVPDSGFSVRLSATTLSYTLLAVFISVYVKSNFRFGKSRAGRAAESLILSAIIQLGAVFKVICIIGIELAVFPIFCGTLLHFSLVPLVDTDSLKDRARFTVESPILSGSLHWAMGTFYMFVFAMFVSLCRRIMRPGVLYFVRDPNDVNFHPLKEVLERPLLFQLNKIAISAIIYSILIIGCIGGVLSFLRYGLNVAFLPLKSHTELSWPVLRDVAILMAPILFTLPRWYNMVSSLSLLKNLWTFWFEVCCSLLRLSSFILNKPYVDEQGHVYRPSWKSFLKMEKPDYTMPVTEEEIGKLDPEGTYFIRDGCYVRAPDTDTLSSDRRLRLFVQVNKDDVRQDGLEEGGDDELKQYDIVYRPPRFGLRIIMLLMLFWLFATAIVTSICLILLYSGTAVARLALGEDIAAELTSYMVVGMGIPPTSLILYLLDKWQEVVTNITETWKILRGETHDVNDSPARYPSLKKFAVLCLSAITFPHLVGNTLLNYFTLSSAAFTNSKNDSILSEHSFIHCWLIGALVIWMAKQCLINLFAQSYWSVQYTNMLQQGWLRYDWNIFMASCASPILKLLLPVRILVEVVPVAFHRYHVFLYQKNIPVDQLDKISYACYSCIYLTMIFVGCVRMNRRLFEKFINSVRDDAYLIGRRLENHSR